MAEKTTPDAPAPGTAPRADTGTTPAGPQDATDTADRDTGTRPASPVDDVVTTHHTLKVGRRTLAYTARTGRVVLREESVKDGVSTGPRPKAEVFLTSYVLDGADPVTRPVTFAFNGGPGSASIWLHLGLLGPRRVLSGDAGSPVVPPGGLVDNTETLLATSDLVFVDPVSTGFSRAAEGTAAKDYHGYTADVESVAEVIRLWVTRHQRWLSPKVVVGESYGTTRASALADHLQSRFGMYLNGVALVSSVLDFASLDFEFRNDRAHALYLPTYAATAHVHGLHGRRGLSGVLKEAEAYAARDYPWALSRGDRLSRAEREDHVARTAALTGLDPAYVDRADLRIEHVRYFTELLRDRGLSVGRLDSRFTGPLASGNAETWDADPSMDAISGPYAAAWNHYVRAELGYESDLPYHQINPVAHQEWSYKDFEGKPVDVVPRLERAMRANPHLHVHVAYGYHDGATPYFAAEDVLAHLRVPESSRALVEHRYYEAGHMMYVHEPSRRQQSTDLANFVTRAARG